MTAEDDIGVLADSARIYAALSGEFDPIKAIEVSFGSKKIDPPVAARIMGLLRSDCTTAADGKALIMRQSPRDRVLANLGPEGIAETSNWNLPDDELATTMRDTLTSDPSDMASRIDVVLANPSPDLERVDTLARAIELAGRATGAVREKLPALQGVLNRNYAIRGIEAQLEQGYFGNEALRERLAGWIDNPVMASFARALYIKGIPGVGKSFLLTKLVHEARERSNPIVLWLDFDRRGLNLVEPDGLTMELARQIGNELPESAVELAQLRAISSGESSQESSKRGRNTMSYALVEAMGKAVQGSGRNTLLILDTLEVLASYGDSHPRRLFEFLDDLLNFGVAPTAIVAAGRGDALNTLGKKRVEGVLPLIGLPDRVATQMLQKLETPAEATDSILDLAHGNPLILRLAAKLAREGGAQAVKIEEFEGKPPEIAGGYLYRAILSRIDGDNLCEIANLGLVMQRVDAGAISQVIGPALKITISDIEAGELLERLATHHWLVEDEPGGWVRHRSDVRQVVLRLLYASRPEQVAAVNEAAAQYLADKDPVAALYHQLQARGPNAPLPTIESTLATQFSEQMIEELDDREADAILQARGERSRSRRKGAARREQQSPEQPLHHLERKKSSRIERVRKLGGETAQRDGKSPIVDQSALTDLYILLEKGDFIEAQRLFNDLFDAVPSFEEPAGRAALCHFWLSGQWSKAKKLYLQYEQNEFRHAHWDGAESLAKLVLLEMRAEFGFDALVAEFEHDEKALREAQLIYRDAKALRLTEGALAYALLAENRPNTISGGWREAVASAGTGLQNMANQESVLRDATNLRDRHNMSSDFGKNPPWEVAACLNPYAAPIATLTALNVSPKLRRYTVGAAARFNDLAPIPFDVDDGNTFGNRVLNRQEAMVERLGALGATADWLSGFTFFHQVAEVPLIARRAEAWRRCAAGEWVYGANAPEGWQDPELGLDRGIHAWLELIIAMPNPTEEAARQLLFWYEPMPGGDEGRAPMGKRSAARLGRALHIASRAAKQSSGDPLFSAARALVSRNIGRSIAVPIAVLALETGGSKNRGSSLEELTAVGGSAIDQILHKED